MPAASAPEGSEDLGVVTTQEEFWAGEFGDAYSARNVGPDWVASKTALFAEVLGDIQVDSVLEIGANVGLNVRALQRLLPGADVSCLEINETAAGAMLQFTHQTPAEARTVLEARGVPVRRSFGPEGVGRPQSREPAR